MAPNASLRITCRNDSLLRGILSWSEMNCKEVYVLTYRTCKVYGPKVNDSILIRMWCAFIAPRFRFNYSILNFARNLWMRCSTSIKFRLILRDLQQRNSYVKTLGLPNAKNILVFLLTNGIIFTKVDYPTPRNPSANSMLICKVFNRFDYDSDVSRAW